MRITSVDIRPEYSFSATGVQLRYVLITFETSDHADMPRMGEVVEFDLPAVGRVRAQCTAATPCSVLGRGAIAWDGSWVVHGSPLPLAEAGAEAVVDAWTVAGPAPSVHTRMQSKLRHEWPVLAAAIERLVAQHGRR